MGVAEECGLHVIKDSEGLCDLVRASLQAFHTRTQSKLHLPAHDVRRCARRRRAADVGRVPGEIFPLILSGVLSGVRKPLTTHTRGRLHRKDFPLLFQIREIKKHAIVYPNVSAVDAMEHLALLW